MFVVFVFVLVGVTQFFYKTVRCISLVLVCFLGLLVLITSDVLVEFFTGGLLFCFFAYCFFLLGSFLSTRVPGVRFNHSLV